MVYMAMSFLLVKTYHLTSIKIGNLVSSFVVRIFTRTGRSYLSKDVIEELFSTRQEIELKIVIFLKGSLYILT